MSPRSFDIPAVFTVLAATEQNDWRPSKAEGAVKFDRITAAKGKPLSRKLSTL